MRLLLSSAAVLLSSTALLPAGLGAQTASVRDTVISVTASRTSRVSPDRASLFVYVEGVAELPADAVVRNETKVKAVIDALKGVGNGVEVERAVTYSVGPTPMNNGYPVAATPPTNVARAVIHVQLQRLDQLARVIATALGAGAANTSAPQFESSVVDSVRRGRMAEALAGAKADAQNLASLLDGHLGSLVDVNTNSSLGFVQPTQLFFDNRFSSSPVQAPEIPITATVTVRYRLVR